MSAKFVSKPNKSKMQVLLGCIPIAPTCKELEKPEHNTESHAHAPKTEVPWSCDGVLNMEASWVSMDALVLLAFASILGVLEKSPWDIPYFMVAPFCFRCEQ